MATEQVDLDGPDHRQVARTLGAYSLRRRQVCTASNTLRQPSHFQDAIPISLSSPRPACRFSWTALFRVSQAQQFTRLPHQEKRLLEGVNSLLLAVDLGIRPTHINARSKLSACIGVGRAAEVRDRPGEAASAFTAETGAAREIGNSLKSGEFKLLKRSSHGPRPGHHQLADRALSGSGQNHLEARLHRDGSSSPCPTACLIAANACILPA
jgi:hypothetical protein